jgi:MFS family permease
MSVAADLRILASAPRDLWLVYAMKWLESVGYFTVYSLAAIYLTDELGYSDIKAGGITGTWLTVVAFVTFVAGFVADSFGIRRALFVAALSCTIGRGLWALVPTREGAMLGLVASIWGIACLKPTMNAAVRAFAPPAAVSFAFSFYYVVMNLGAVAQGPLIDGFRLYVSEGATVAGMHFSASRLVFLVGFGLSAVNLLLAASIREEARPAQPNPVAVAREVMVERAFWRFMLFVALLTFVRLIFQHAHQTWPKYTLREFGATFPYATWWAINPAMIIVLTPAVTAATRRFAAFPVIVGGAVLSASSVFAMAVSNTVAGSLVFIVTLSLGEALWAPRLYEYTATVAPRGREASYMGLSELPLFVGKSIVGFLSGWLLQTWCPAEGPRSPQLMWAVVGAMSIAAPVLMVALRSRIEGGVPEGKVPEGKVPEGKPSADAR